MKTAVENEQNLIVEGCYIPFDWSKDFAAEYLTKIKFYCLVMSEKYINNHFHEIMKYADVIEKRIEDEGLTIDTVLRDNAEILKLCRSHKLEYILIDNEYQVNLEL